MVPCGCILYIDGNFPKKPWVHVESFRYVCARSCENAYGERSLGWWVNKETIAKVDKGVFDAAWLRAKKVASIFSRDVVRINKWDGVLRDGRAFESIAAAPMEKELGWPPKMSELLKTSK